MPEPLQPSKEQLRDFHREHEDLLNFPVLWVDDPLRVEIAAALTEVLSARGYTCYAAAICANHMHMAIRTHRDKARTMWEYFAQGMRDRLRLRLSEQVSPHHPVISSRPHNVTLVHPGASPRADCVRGR